jgi:hypothetical protein
MFVLDFLAEQKIAEAVSRGELDGLPGAGRPLDLDDDALVPEDLRVAYRILRNAGFVPREVEDLKAGKKIALLGLRVEPRYYGRLVGKLGR